MLDINEQQFAVDTSIIDELLKIMRLNKKEKNYICKKAEKMIFLNATLTQSRGKKSNQNYLKHVNSSYKNFMSYALTDTITDQYKKANYILTIVSKLKFRFNLSDAIKC